MKYLSPGGGGELSLSVFLEMGERTSSKKKNWQIPGGVPGGEGMVTARNESCINRKSLATQATTGQMFLVFLFSLPAPDERKESLLIGFGRKKVEMLCPKTKLRSCSSSTDSYRCRTMERETS